MHSTDEEDSPLEDAFRANSLRKNMPFNNSSLKLPAFGCAVPNNNSTYQHPSIREKIKGVDRPTKPYKRRARLGSAQARKVNKNASADVILVRSLRDNDSKPMTATHKAKVDSRVATHGDCSNNNISVLLTNVFSPLGVMITNGKQKSATLMMTAIELPAKKESQLLLQLRAQIKNLSLERSAFRRRIHNRSSMYRRRMRLYREKLYDLRIRLAAREHMDTVSTPTASNDSQSTRKSKPTKAKAGATDQASKANASRRSSDKPNRRTYTCSCYTCHRTAKLVQSHCGRCTLCTNCGGNYGNHVDCECHEHKQRASDDESYMGWTPLDKCCFPEVGGSDSEASHATDTSANGEAAQVEQKIELLAEAADAVDHREDQHDIAQSANDQPQQAEEGKASPASSQMYSSAVLSSGEEMKGSGDEDSSDALRDSPNSEGKLDDVEALQLADSSVLCRCRFGVCHRKRTIGKFCDECESCVVCYQQYDEWPTPTTVQDVCNCKHHHYYVIYTHILEKHVAVAKVSVEGVQDTDTPRTIDDFHHTVMRIVDRNPDIANHPIVTTDLPESEFSQFQQPSHYYANQDEKSNPPAPDSIHISQCEGIYSHLPSSIVRSLRHVTKVANTKTLLAAIATLPRTVKYIHDVLLQLSSSIDMQLYLYEVFCTHIHQDVVHLAHYGTIPTRLTPLLLEAIETRYQRLLFFLDSMCAHRDVLRKQVTLLDYLHPTRVLSRRQRFIVARAEDLVDNVTYNTSLKFDYAFYGPVTVTSPSAQFRAQPASVYEGTLRPSTLHKRCMCKRRTCHRWCDQTHDVCVECEACYFCMYEEGTCNCHMGYVAATESREHEIPTVLVWAHHQSMQHHTRPCIEIALCKLTRDFHPENTLPGQYVSPYVVRPQPTLADTTHALVSMRCGKTDTNMFSDDAAANALVSSMPRALLDLCPDLVTNPTIKIAHCILFAMGLQYRLIRFERLYSILRLAMKHFEEHPQDSIRLRQAKRLQTQRYLYAVKKVKAVVQRLRNNDRNLPATNNSFIKYFCIGLLNDNPIELVRVKDTHSIAAAAHTRRKRAARRSNSSLLSTASSSAVASIAPSSRKRSNQALFTVSDSVNSSQAVQAIRHKRSCVHAPQQSDHDIHLPRCSVCHELLSTTKHSCMVDNGSIPLCTVCDSDLNQDQHVCHKPLPRSLLAKCGVRNESCESELQRSYIASRTRSRAVGPVLTQQIASLQSIDNMHLDSVSPSSEACASLPNATTGSANVNDTHSLPAIVEQDQGRSNDNTESAAHASSAMSSSDTDTNTHESADPAPRTLRLVNPPLTSPSSTATTVMMDRRGSQSSSSSAASNSATSVSSSTSVLRPSVIEAQRRMEEHYALQKRRDDAARLLASTLPLVSTETTVQELEDQAYNEYMLRIQLIHGNSQRDRSHSMPVTPPISSQAAPIFSSFSLASQTNNDEMKGEREEKYMHQSPRPSSHANNPERRATLSTRRRRTTHEHACHDDDSDDDSDHRLSSRSATRKRSSHSRHDIRSKAPRMCVGPLKKKRKPTKGGVLDLTNSTDQDDSFSDDQSQCQDTTDDYSFSNTDDDDSERRHKHRATRRAFRKASRSAVMTKSTRTRPSQSGNNDNRSSSRHTTHRRVAQSDDDEHNRMDPITDTDSGDSTPPDTRPSKSKVDRFNGTTSLYDFLQTFRIQTQGHPLVIRKQLLKEAVKHKDTLALIRLAEQTLGSTAINFRQFIVAVLKVSMNGKNSAQLELDFMTCVPDSQKSLLFFYSALIEKRKYIKILDPASSMLSLKALINAFSNNCSDPYLVRELRTKPTITSRSDLATRIMTYMDDIGKAVMPYTSNVYQAMNPPSLLRTRTPRSVSFNLPAQTKTRPQLVMQAAVQDNPTREIRKRSNIRTVESTQIYDAPNEEASSDSEAEIGTAPEEVDVHRAPKARKQQPSKKGTKGRKKQATMMQAMAQYPMVPYATQLPQAPPTKQFKASSICRNCRQRFGNLTPQQHGETCALRKAGVRLCFVPTCLSRKQNVTFPAGVNGISVEWWKHLASSSCQQCAHCHGPHNRVTCPKIALCEICQKKGHITDHHSVWMQTQPQTDRFRALDINQ